MYHVNSIFIAEFILTEYSRVCVNENFKNNVRLTPGFNGKVLILIIEGKLYKKVWG